MSGPTLEDVAKVRNIREQAAQAIADHQHLTNVRNRFIAGTSTREEIFLALNTAATQVLILSQKLQVLADFATNFYKIKEEETLTPRQRQPPALRLIAGGKGSTKPAPKRKPRQRKGVEA